MHILMLIYAAIVAVPAFSIWLILWATSKRVVVPTNMVHIVQSGRKTVSYGKGRAAGNVFYQWPSHIPFIGVTVTELQESVFTVELNNYEAYDSGRLPFKVDVRAFYRISDSDVAAHRVSSFAQLQAQLQAVLQGAVRRVLATNPLESIMQDRSKLGGEFTQEVDPQLTEWGVQTVKSIEFMDIRDHDGSQVIANIMAKEKSRIDMESRIAVATNSQAAQSREIEAQQAVQIRKTEAEQMIGQRQAEAQKNVGLAGQQAQQEVLAQTKITAEREMDVKRVNEVQQASIDKDVAEVHAQQIKAVSVTEAEGQAQQTEIVAKGNLEASKRAAEGIKVTGLAKAEAEAAMLQAPVTAQVNLAKEIGSNDGYQKYLIGVRQVEANQAVGVAQAEAIGKANVKVIANGGTVSGGISSIAEIFSSKGGTAIASMLEGLAQTEEGSALLARISPTPPTK